MKRWIIVINIFVGLLILWFFVVGPILIEKQIIPETPFGEYKEEIEGKKEGQNTEFSGSSKLFLNSKNENIVLSLNFNESNMPDGLVPMGEMVTHDIETNPRGHEGIDFTWERKVPIYAFADGIVIAIKKSEGHKEGIWDVGVRNGRFLNSYTELEDYNMDLMVGKKVKKGEFIGFPWHPPETHEGYRMFHWNFGYWISGGKDIYPERLCPINYLDNESKVLIEKIWEGTRVDYKSEYPLICNGYFENRDR